MPRIIFIGDKHDTAGSIAKQFGRYTSNYGEIIGNYVLLLEVNFDGSPEEGKGVGAISYVTADKGDGADRMLLTKLSQGADFCYGFDDDSKSTFSNDRQKAQFKNIQKLAGMFPGKSIVVVVGEAHLEVSPNELSFSWAPHHEYFDDGKHDVFCYSTGIAWDDK